MVEDIAAFCLEPETRTALQISSRGATPAISSSTLRRIRGDDLLGLVMYRDELLKSLKRERICSRRRTATQIIQSNLIHSATSDAEHCQMSELVGARTLSRHDWIAE
jgi:hypothetical protein